MDLKSTYYHSNLAVYFANIRLYHDEPTQKKPNTRKLVEQPWQQTKGKMWDEVTDTLCNLDFIQAKASAKMTFELVYDFNVALEVIPDNAETIRQDNARQARMDKYTRDLIACAKGELTTDKLEIPESITPWTKEQTEDEIERIKTNPNRADRLRDFMNFLGQEATNLQYFAGEFACFTHQQAWNYVAEGPVGNAAGELTPSVSKYLLRRSPPTRPPWNPQPQTLQTLKGHTSHVWAVALTADGKRAISGSGDNTCILWDLQSGEALARIVTNSAITSGAIYPDSILLGCGSGEVMFLFTDKELLHPGIAITTIRQIWDFELQQYQELSADCPLCGHRFAPPVSVLETIEKITKKAGLKPEQSPCLELPDEAWEETGLLSNCPKCGEVLKFNPFIA